MSDLISALQVAKNFGLEEAVVVDVLKAAKLKSSRLVLGKDPITLFDQNEATSAVQAHITAAKEALAKKLKEEEESREPTMREIMVKLKSMEKDLADVAELQEEIRRINTANHGIFKALTDFKTDTQDRLAGIKNLVIGARDEVQAIKKSPTPQPEPVAKKSIAVVGVSKVHHPKLQEQYGSKFDLKLIDPSDIRGIYQVKKYGVVYAMTKFTDMRHAEQMKAAKISPVFLGGGLDTLETTLDEVAFALGQNHF